ncbi:MAG: ECF transporter S component [Oscillospiraceae bacterium]|nr:ECF transporter S component [Oscillospiraceae bacterium]
MQTKLTTRKMIYAALMTALVYVATLIAFPLLGSKVRLANPVSLLGSLLLGPVMGGMASGLGSLIYDIQTGYGFEGIITFVSKFAMAWVCGKIAFANGKNAEDHKRNIVACTAGAWTYVALYMLKTFVMQRFVASVPMEGVLAAMAGKLPASSINAVAAMVIAPILYIAIRPALKSTGQLDAMRT